MTTTEQAALCFHLYNPVYPASERTRGLNQECGWDEAFSYGARFAAECERRRDKIAASMDPEDLDRARTTGALNLAVKHFNRAHGFAEGRSPFLSKDDVASQFGRFIANPDRDLRRSCTDSACCGPEERIHVQDLESFLRQTGIYK